MQVEGYAWSLTPRAGAALTEINRRTLDFHSAALPSSYHLVTLNDAVLGFLECTAAPTPSAMLGDWQVRPFTPPDAGGMAVCLLSVNDRLYRFSRRTGNPLATAWGDVSWCHFLDYAALHKMIPTMVPRAVQWSRMQEQRILANGSALTPDDIHVAQKIGVKNPQRVRVQHVAMVPPPNDPALAEVCRLVGISGDTITGQTFGHGIFVRTDCSTNRQLLAHELVHVKQYEERGGIEGFVRDYADELATHGYATAPMELEAIQLSRPF